MTARRENPARFPQTYPVEGNRQRQSPPPTILPYPICVVHPIFTFFRKWGIGNLVLRCPLAKINLPALCHCKQAATPARQSAAPQYSPPEPAALGRMAKPTGFITKPAPQGPILFGLDIKQHFSYQKEHGWIWNLSLFYSPCFYASMQSPEGERQNLRPTNSF